MTPPLSIRATSIPDEDLAETAANEKKAAAPKKNEWDMFAEQDLDSNFDVSEASFDLFQFLIGLGPFFSPPTQLWPTSRCMRIPR